MKTAAAFPSWWIRQGQLKNLGAGAATTGQSIAALKVYLAIALSADALFSDVRITLTQLRALTGMSHPMVLAGIAQLESLGVIAVDRSAYRNVYRLIQGEGQAHFSKLPRELVRAGLKRLPNATAEALAALKTYLVLLTVRQRNSHLAPVSHRRIQTYTAIRPGLICKGTSILIEHGFVKHANRPLFWNAAGYQVNTYYLVGVLGEHDLDLDLATALPPAEVSDHDAPLEPELQHGDALTAPAPEAGSSSAVRYASAFPSS